MIVEDDNDDRRYFIRLKCPFCDGEATVNSATYSATHTFPMCREFEEKNPLEYLIAVNDKLGMGRA